MDSGQQVAPWIPIAPKLACIGQSVGRQEARLGRPFIGPAGQQLRAWLASLGLDPDDDVMYTNVTMTYHPEKPNYVPSPKEVAAASLSLTEEVCDAGAAAVVLLGGSASKLVFKGRISLVQGRRGEFAGLPTWACYHPSYYLRAVGYKQRAEIENAVVGVLSEAVAAACGHVREVVLPTPTYPTGEVHIT